MAPSQLVSATAPAPQIQANLRSTAERGVRIHRVLELLQAESDAHFIAKLVAHIAPDWSAEEQAKTTREITTLYEQYRWLWQHPRHAEASICGNITVHGRALPIQGQMDLLVETPDEVVILDYKTGRNVPATPGDVSANYLLQLKAYHALVAQLYPAKTIRCAILWTAMPRLMWLDEAVAAVDWPTIGSNAA